MKKVIFLAALLVVASINNSFGQTNLKTDPSQLLTLYYDIKDALVSGNANTASAKAEDFVKAINSIDIKAFNEASREALLKDATHISESKDIKHQREHFAPFSDNMITLAKTVKLSAEPVYQQYCPMKKASWLSSQQAIKNPYYGSAMLTCGSVKATL
ncbi:MAG: hypothetical protein B7Y15_12705 [Bacteroidetes bacterium 24-39-8]|nr:MAG: hypothetical protein B7Y76_00935 [Sphingobacteriia bacterium 35-40-5]OYZ48087.1 MAG: hypothetical protein B7Y15_12705 [Bacteroidetes bacterium 24-39-8]OZA56244.1 MAG: hypothetical protein B7X75_06605 [Sphingobacteriales bacterium 39-40-5]HQS04066.1 DUF3347 domain-containing protein [Daejeonella sp.]HQS52393.1 DUF3347 domain-containing protein [Daejeonella sp.]